VDFCNLFFCSNSKLTKNAGHLPAGRREGARVLAGFGAGPQGFEVG